MAQARLQLPVGVVFTSEKFLVKGDVLIDDYPVNLSSGKPNGRTERLSVSPPLITKAGKASGCMTGAAWRYY